MSSESQCIILFHHLFWKKNKLILNFKKPIINLNLFTILKMVNRAYAFWLILSTISHERNLHVFVHNRCLTFNLIDTFPQSEHRNRFYESVKKFNCFWQNYIELIFPILKWLLLACLTRFVNGIIVYGYQHFSVGIKI